MVAMVVVLLAMSGFPLASQAAPSATLVPTRTSGTAPLAVFFDATGTTDSDASVDTFREVGYRFDFGDPESGTWPVSGLPKNVQIGGPLAAHVYEQPGEYTVQLTAQGADGMRSTASTTITVRSADEAFAGTATVCVSRDADFTGCPAGAQRLSNASAWPSFTSNRRYLLRAGQDFTALGDISFGQERNIQINSFGSGAKPVIGRISMQVMTPRSAAWLEDVVIANLDVLNIAHQSAAINLLVFRNSLVRGGMIDLGGAFLFNIQNTSFPGWIHPRGIFVVENTIDRNYDNVVNRSVNGHTGRGSRYVVMGNQIDRTREHQVRLWQVNRAFIAHNRLTGRSSDNIRHTLKLHSGGTEPYTESLVAPSTPRTRSSQLVIANNAFGSATSNINWLIAVAPQNSQEEEGLEDAVIESNTFQFGSNYNLDAQYVGRRITDRGNTSINRNGPARVNGATSGYNLPAEWYGPYFLNQEPISISAPQAAPAPPELNVQ